MNCPICSRASTSRLHFYCPTCALNQLYRLRIENARVLLEKENIGQRIENAVLPQGSHAIPRSHEDCSSQQLDATRPWAIRQITNAQSESSFRTKDLARQIEELQSEIKQKQLSISQRRLALARRRSDAESAKFQLEGRENSILCGVQNNIKRTEHLWHSLHSKTAEDRIFLCREAANLYGLRQRLRKNDGGMKETYVIGGVPILDLRDLNGTTPCQVSTSLCNVARLLVLVSHYLSLKLPAEITLPHRNYPTPTIHVPTAFHISRETNSVPPLIQSRSPGASSSHAVDSHLPHLPPRPLSIDRSLSKLAREDPGTYVLFLEGVTLLAWDVSWLCRTQGLNVASDSWEEITDIGKNLWQLLVAPPMEAVTLMRVFAGREIQPKAKVPGDTPRTSIQRIKSFPMLGHYSHGTVHSFLGASEGTEFMKTWRLPTPTKVFDKLKSSLLGEIASAEWELLEDKEWDDSDQDPLNVSLQGLSISSRRHPEDEIPSDKCDATHTASTDVTSPEQDNIGSKASRDSISAGRPKGTSGWTKLRNR